LYEFYCDDDQLWCSVTVPELNEIQDAYVIAVEEQARQRLEQLSSLHKVEPVDIAKLGRDLKWDFSDSVEKNSIYVKSKENNNTDHKCSPKRNSIDSDTGKDKGVNSSAVEPCGHDNRVYDVNEEDQGDKESLCLMHDKESSSTHVDSPQNMDTVVMNGYVNGQSHSPVPAEVDPRFHLSIKDTPPPKYGYSSSLYSSTERHKPRHIEHVYEDVDQSPAEDSDVNENVPHSEMAIDVPDHFHGSKKEPPRYPPPLSSNTRSSPKHTPSGTPVKHPEVLSERHNLDNSNATTLMEPPQMTRQEHLEHLERIKHYQEDLRKRREEESRLVREQEFLRE